MNLKKSYKLSIIGLNRFYLVGICLLFISPIACVGKHTKESKVVDIAKQPNILFILTDDHASKAISAYGGGLNETPNIDRLANEGIRFDRCFVNNSICGPSRAAILTGKFSHINGLTDNGIKFDNTQVTFPKLLQQAGYSTAVVGKWHLGSQPSGFDYWNVLPGQGDYYNPEFIEMGDTTVVKGYVTDVITDISLKWLKKRDANKPFCLLYHHKAPHRNWMPAPRHLNLYDSINFPVPESLFDDYKNRGTAARTQEMEIDRHMYPIWDFKLATLAEMDAYIASNRYKNKNDNGLDSKSKNMLEANDKSADLAKFLRVYEKMTVEQRKAWHKAYDPKTKAYREANLNEKERLEWKYQRYVKDYLRSVAAVDENIGKMIKHLEETGELDNTIIVYTSDQGFYLGEHGWFDKRFMYEQSYGTPLIIRYPKKIKKETVSKALAMNIDLSPTLLDLAGIEIPEDIQGASLTPILENNGTVNSNWRKATYYHYYEYPSWHSVKRHYGIRTERYKLIHFYNDVDEWELYDLENDSQELDNIYHQPENKALIDALKDQLKELQIEYKDLDPTEQKIKFFQK
ncbi:sulfatase [Flavivirga spongiicola]|uniref:Sulfatase n=1 Tax=Flavivirga spongiicola TaxID=421621 RepID=A0ABU7XWV1_9FLAO|nr:sulfatase [Flavivirga sp. MEBiC05379]MDO5980057.1 sulfatase [Flavivirga sp. MEBiC05379]